MNHLIHIIRRLLGPALIGVSVAAAAPVALQATGGDGTVVKRISIKESGRSLKVWPCDGKSGPLTFRTAGPVAAPPGGAFYLEISYLDKGYGSLSVQFTADGKSTIRPDRFLRMSRTDSGKIVAARMRIPEVDIEGTSGVALRVGLEHSQDQALAIQSVTLQEEPFAEPDFRYVVSDPWLGPYQGVTVKPRDNTTLKGKVMTGYQGWFRTPNDPEGRGWVHWGNIQDGTFSVDMWPDVSQYPAHSLEKAADVKLASGKQAYLFSSAWPSVVDTHFRWMRENDIDGAFLQRFVSDNFNSMSGGPEWVLANVRAAANREGRVWAVEYDISGYPDSKLLETLKTDWKWFVDKFEVLKDPNYAREGGKPVVFIWGLPFPNRNISPTTANAVVDFFRNDPEYGGNHVIGGIPGNWRDMDAAWQEHFKRYECVLSWMSQSYEEDIRDFDELGLSYYAHVKPGFSWANLKHLPSGDPTLQYTPREGGKHYWNQLEKAARAGADRLFVGMFDEYDEGTAIMPMSDDAPRTPVRPGVAATFYNGANPQEQGEFVRLPDLTLDLGATAPGRRITPDHFYVRMGGQIVFPAAGRFVLTVEGAPGDDVELVLKGERVLAAKNITGPSTVKVAVRAGEVIPYRLDYRHRDASGTLRVFWEGPGVSRQPVPATALQDAWGRFIGNDGKSPDWWLKLTKKGKALMNRKQREGSDTL